MIRRRHAWTLTATLVALLPVVAACGDSGTCADDNRCPTAGSGAAGSTGAGGDGGQGGTGGSLPEDCEASPLEDGSVIRDECGVFVDATAAAGGDGTKGKPFQTIGEAVGNAGAKRIYVCGAQTFEEAVDIDGNELVGGLRCNDGSWAYEGADPTKRTILAPAESGAIPLTLGSSATAVAGLSVLAPVGTEPGDSSIAVVVAGGSAKITDCDLTAQDTADGAAGEAPTGTGELGIEGEDGVDGLCQTAVNVGGPGGEKVCGAVDATGGPGGNGTNTLTGGTPGGGAGTPGAPPNDGAAGVPETSGGSCSAGHAGGDGASGDAGTGAAERGTLNASGYQASMATDGASAGVPGQGGGGGGGANECPDVTKAGPGGGGGGSGGCGGAPGKAGQSAGSSIGLVSANATITLTRVAIASGKAGNGGDGGNGQEGGDGGQPGGADGAACAGGKGGKGGRGGSGGGGHGGHSLAIAWQGVMPSTIDSDLASGTAGDGGIGGDNDTSEAVIGGKGESCATLDFASGECAP